MFDISAGRPDEQFFILSSLPPSPAQKRLAVAVVLALVVAFIITAGPLKSLRPPRVDAFIPAYGASIFVNDAITAVLLFSQFSILRSRALLVISCGYLYTALIAIPWMLTFPGVFAPGGLLGAGKQSTAWLYIFWHGGFSLFVIAYAVLKEADSAKQAWTTSRYAAMLSGVAVIALVCAATFLAAADDAKLPPLMLDTVHVSVMWEYTAGCTALLGVATLFALWIRQHSMLDLWLMVVMCAYVIDVVLNSFPVPGRFSVGWYAGRVFGLFSGSLVLIVLLYEITTLYARLLHAVLAQRREREARLMTGNAVAAMIAHEIKQPLTGMTTQADAGFRWLDRAAPDLGEAKQAFKKISANGHRAGVVIESIRAIFKGETPSRTSFDVNKLIEEALVFLRGDLQKHRVSVYAEPNARLPAVIGEPIQLRQVLLNLMTNAIDSMATAAGPRILSVRAEMQAGGVLVSVSDTGKGIKSEDAERVFNPLFTTKSGGMGMGLSICRSIIESHDSRLWVTPNIPQGAVFQFVLPPDNATCTAANLGRDGTEPI